MIDNQKYALKFSKHCVYSVYLQNIFDIISLENQNYQKTPF